MKILFKIDNKNKERQWSIWTEGDTLVQEAGLIGGKLVQHRKVCKPKNSGKSNSTTSEQQAISEMESTYKDKLSEGYFTTIEEAKNTEVVLPMLAHSFSDHKNKIDWSNCYIQPKFDGMRMFAIVKDGNCKLISRAGKEITTLDHIKNTYELLNNNGLPNGIYDGEAYVFGEGFQRNMELIKKTRPETVQVKHWVYDFVAPNSFIDRSKYIFKMLLGTSQYIEVVKTVKCNSEEDLKKHHIEILKQGFEGTMIRFGNEGYQMNKRSSNLLKYKNFQDLALPIIDIIPNDADPTQGTPIFELNGKTFKAGVKMSHEKRKDLLANKKNYIGEIGEIRFFEYSEEGVPRFPVFLCIKLDK